MTGVALQLIGLTKRFGDVVAVSPLNLTIEPGAFVVLVGPSGCGKTTVLRMIAGLAEPSGGDILVGGARVNDLEPAERNIAMVFQNYALYPHMRVRDNLAFGLRMRRTPRDEAQRRVQWAAALLDIESLLDRKPGQLSGGQRQRVALGRALVREPRVFLFDEPLSNLDARLRTDMRAELAALHARLNTTMVYVTHDQIEAMTLGQKIAVLKDGVLQQYGTPLEVYDHPANLFVAGFLGSPPMNAVEGTVETANGRAIFSAQGIAVTLPTVSHRGPATLGIRPEALQLVPGDATPVAIRCAVSRVEVLGNEVLVHLAGPGDGRWIARVPPGAAPGPGTTVGASIDPARVHLFSPGGERLR